MSFMVAVLTPGGESLPAMVGQNTTAADVLEQCALEIDMCPSYVDLTCEGDLLKDTDLVVDTGIADGGVLEMVESKKAIAIRKLGSQPEPETFLQAITDGETTDRIDLMIDAGVMDTETALHCACVNNHIDAVELLIKRGANINAKQSTRGSYPLHDSQCCCSARIILENGGDADCVDNHGQTTLHTTQELSVVKTLLEFGADINKQATNGNTPLMSCYHGADYCPQIARTLIEAGTDLTVENTEGKNVLHTVKDIENASLIIKKEPSLLNSRTRDGDVPLNYCWGMRAQPEMAKLLVENGADVNVQNNQGLTPLHYVENYETAELLLSHGADLTIADNLGRTPLHSCFGDVEYWPDIAKLYIDNGADINAVDSNGYILLHYVSDIDITKRIIDMGSDINLQSKTGLTPLMYRCTEW